MKTGILKVETSLGIFHATSSRKNLSLMSGSFALSIILFLCFSVLIELLGCMLPTKLSSPDLSIGSRDVSNSIEHELIREISEMEGVEHAFGRSLKSDIPAEFSVGTEQNTVDLLSYDKLQLSWLQEDGDLRKGSDLQKVYGNSNYVLAIWDQDSPIDIGDKIQLCGSEVEVAGLLKCSPFTNSGSTGGEIDLICSEETFTRLTGEKNFAIIDVQVTKEATDADVAAIDKMAAQKCDPEIYEFRDRREEADRDTYWSFALFIYGFLAVIALIAVLNIVNSISMSVSAKIRQYGAMQAVGMDGLQVTKMIAAEALTYAFAGCIIGCVAGLPLSKLLYDVLITSHFPYETWSIPIQSLLIIVLFVVVAAAISVYAPSMRIRKLTVTDTINEL